MVRARDDRRYQIDQNDYLNYNNVSSSESGGEYFQVIFKKNIDEEKEYILINRQLEFPDGGKCYFECPVKNFVGHFKVKEAELKRDSLYIKFYLKNLTEIKINFSVSEKDFEEVRRDSGCYFIMMGARVYCEVRKCMLMK